jgi:hypothetical protein
MGVFGLIGQAVSGPLRDVQRSRQHRYQRGPFLPEIGVQWLSGCVASSHVGSIRWGSDTAYI